MSNRSEILTEYREASEQLNELKQYEASHVVPCHEETITIKPKYGQRMQALSNKCDYLNMILEAMAASED
ncbi:hypothetical protein FD04_GL001243 [Secundilactobacillus odoratitofui DSM 19909 = JCM 15043]|uniref:Uncharacterized protein n=1 Tax=Secundilactobacillus odoratitofui DSM 19909 = JCM 15043 TaxID=1423776 RepID=A0A0R1M2Y3_9LACO|nr:hypothetical protein [Secundilactobacillus odoratitofui]KRK98263.1 hypothetical protein FD04_GL001243 [Secundilactobacillus odoratitofui DSM 19909 = JCM 15043]